MSDDPDRLRREIEHTQRNLSADVDVLAEKVTPSRIVNRKVGHARHALSNARDAVMGSASDTASTVTDRVGGVVSSVAGSAGSVASDAASVVGQAPQAVRQGTRGNPLAAGLIAFGAGWLLSSLAPASGPERQVAGQAAEWVRDHGEPLAQQAGQMADQVRESLREPAQHAVEAVRSSASDAASTVVDEARSGTGDVVGRAQEARSTVQQHQS
jgi:ElaB/YqjD/DUF883 family membrane-anchored ribosome-binding protein